MITRHEDDVASMAAVPAAWAATGNKFLPAKCENTVATVTGFHGNERFIDELQIIRFLIPDLGGIGWATAETGLALGQNIDEFPHAPAIAKFDCSGNGGKEGVILTQSHVLSGLITRTALTDDDGTTGDELAGEHLDAQPLRIRIATVLRTT